MTREQLDAIRARVEAAKTEEGWEPVHTIHKASYVDDTYTGFQACCPIVFCGEYGGRSSDDANELSYAHMDLIGNAPADITALLAEVERLRDAHAMAVQVSGEPCEKCGWAMKFPGEKCRCELLAEVERLTAERDTAFSRGVAAMREAAAVVAGPNPKWPQPLYDRVHQARADAIRALPDPEDEP